MPCQDNVGIENHCQADDGCNKESEDHNECQPFCNCACCSTVIIDQLVSLEMSVPFIDEGIPFSYVIESSSKFLPSIWQPPQLS